MEQGYNYERSKHNTLSRSFVWTQNPNIGWDKRKDKTGTKIANIKVKWVRIINLIARAFYTMYVWFVVEAIIALG